MDTVITVLGLVSGITVEILLLVLYAKGIHSTTENKFKQTLN